LVNFSASFSKFLLFVLVVLNCFLLLDLGVFDSLRDLFSIVGQFLAFGFEFSNLLFDVALLLLSFVKFAIDISGLLVKRVNNFLFLSGFLAFLLTFALNFLDHAIEHLLVLLFSSFYLSFLLSCLFQLTAFNDFHAFLCGSRA